MHAAQGVLSEAGAGAARYDVQQLASHVLGVSWLELWTDLRKPLDDDTVAGLESALARRAGGEPLAYITGVVHFADLDLECGPAALVPRPETETLVDVVCSEVEAVAHPIVVDIGTGTGAVALAVRRRVPQARVWATDISDDSLQLARRNAAATGLELNFALGDLFEPLSESLRGTIDVIASNPPYVSKADGKTLGFSVDAEPVLALFADEDGDAILNRLVDEAPTWLTPTGFLAMEVGTTEQSQRIMQRLSGWRESSVASDYAGRPRVVWARR